MNRGRFLIEFKFIVVHFSGLDVVPLLEAIGASEKVIKAFQLPGVGNAAVAYLCYKVATPLRYQQLLLFDHLHDRDKSLSA